MKKRMDEKMNKKEEMKNETNQELGMNKLVFEKLPIEVGYSSHGNFSALGEIIEIEAERDNEPFINFEESDLLGYRDYPAIWVTRSPINAFRYVLTASEWELSDEELMKTYPNWREDIEEIDCSNLYGVAASDDGDDGVLMVDLRTFSKK